MDQEEPVSQVSPPAFDDPLEDLFTEAMLARKMRVKRREADPSLRQALDAATKKMRELYTLPENWTRTRGVALIDKGTHTLIGNFSEYQHNTTTARKLIREHQLISIEATELVEGYLGTQIEGRLRGQSWDAEHQATVHLILDELMVEAPDVKMVVHSRLGAVVRADLATDTQLASASGATILLLPAGTNVWEAASADSKAAMRKVVHS
jgi:hypothetical protein